MAKGVDIEMALLDEEHVRAKITWSEQDVGGGKLVVEVTVKNDEDPPKKALAVAISHERLPTRLRISTGMRNLPY